MKTTTKHRAAVLLLAAVCAGVCADAQRVLSLRDCQEYALQNNAKIKGAGMDIRMAKESQAMARSSYIPSVSASMSVFDASDDMVSIDLPSIPGMGPLGTMGLVNDGRIGGVTATLPVYAGGRIHNSNKLADIALETKKLQLAQSEGEVRLATARYYWQTVNLKARIETLDRIDAQLAELYKNVKVSVDAGVALQNDLLQVSLKRNEQSSARLKLEDALSLSRMLLAQYIGMGLDSVDTEELPDYSMPHRPDSLYADPAVALGKTAEYRMMQNGVSSGQLQQKMALGKNLPTLSLGGGYSYTNITDKDRTMWHGFATVSIPVSSWIGGTHEVRRQKIAVENARLSLRDNSEMMQLQMADKWNKTNEAYRQLSIALESIGQAEENLRLMQNQYDAGVRTMSDLLEAQTLYQRSRNQFADARTDYEVCCAEYLKATGR